jgi:hypothetical protein
MINLIQKAFNLLVLVLLVTAASAYFAYNEGLIEGSKFIEESSNSLFSWETVGYARDKTSSLAATAWNTTSGAATQSWGFVSSSFTKLFS